MNAPMNNEMHALTGCPKLTKENYRRSLLALLEGNRGPSQTAADKFETKRVELGVLHNHRMGTRPDLKRLFSNLPAFVAISVSPCTFDPKQDIPSHA